MEYVYVKSLHIIFIVTWFSGLFYLVRLFVYHAEAQQQTEPAREILSAQYLLMIRRLWFGITWPSAVLTAIFGGWMWYLYGSSPGWLLWKLGFVLLLFAYHGSLHRIYSQQMRADFRWSSAALRIWNEAATVLLVAIVMLVVVKDGMSLLWGLGGLALFILLLLAAIRLYKYWRKG